MKNEELARSILETIGGEDNIQTVTHCATRLRLTLKNLKKADKQATENLNGVLSVVTQNGQFQVVIGNQVDKVYRELIDQTELSNKPNIDTNTNENGENQGLLARVLDIISGIFVPIIPALAGAGMLKALLTIINFAGWVNVKSSTHQILSFISDTSFYFLPILIAYSASVKFKTNPFLSMTLGGVLLHPNFIAMVELSNETGQGIEFMQIPVRAVTYGSSVIPIILIIWLLSYVEPVVNRIIPGVIRIFTAPLLIFLILGPLALFAIGPLGTYLGDGLALFVTWINGFASWLIPMIIGAFTPFIVMVGMHYALISVGINSLAQTGMETIAGPGMLVSNIAQGGAVLALSIKTKNTKMKSLAVSTGISAVLGITEPALYGVELRNRPTLISAMVGGALGGMYLGVMDVARYVQVPPSIIGLTGFIGSDGLNNLIHASIGAAIAFIAAFIMQLILGEDKDADFADVVEEESEEIGNDTILNSPHDVDAQLSEPTTIYAPIEGNVVSLSEVPDDVFASGALGQGVAIQPSEGEVYAPFDGKVTASFPNNHAIGLTSDTGIELLIHCGLETVNLNGKGFVSHLKDGQAFKKGDLLLSMELSSLLASNFNMITPIIVTNSTQYQQIDQSKEGVTQVGDPLIVIQ